MSGMVQDHAVQKAVSNIKQRAERHEDLEKLVGTFVDVGALAQLENTNHQIFYGRRGTGKTHVLRVLESHLTADDQNTVIYLDARTLGSSAQFTDSEIPLRKRVLSIYRDILEYIHDAVLNHIVSHESSETNQALDALDILTDSITQPYKFVQETERKTTETKDEQNDVSSQVSVELPPKIRAGITSKRGESGRETIEKTYKVDTEDKVIFPAISRSLKSALRFAKTRLFLLIDEWSSIPVELQPYVADFIKRSILPLQRVTVKIASLEYRSKFSLIDDQNIIGFELGADIATSLDLDDFYVYDRSPVQIVGAFSEMLMKHLGSELESNYLEDTYSIRNNRIFRTKLFTEYATFEELVRAAEGVVRDLINIFSMAFINSLRLGRKNIDKASIVKSAGKWFEEDKAQQLDEPLRSVLKRIVDEVIGNRKAKSFLVPRELEQNKIIQRLFDARVLHLMQKGYADKDNPGLRYNIYTLDYGTYVDLIGSSKQPDLDFLKEGSEPDLVVPFEDKRSIRRIILREEHLVV